MADFRLDFSGDRMPGDIVLDGSRFAEDGGLETAVLLSLFIDRRANPDDEIPDGEDDPRGYWGDAKGVVEGEVIDDRIGSRLWLIRRSVLNDETVTRAREYALEGLENLRTDGVAKAIRVATEAQGDETLAIAVEIDEEKGGTQRFSFAWNLIGGVVSSGS